jgi:hypothetical protein
VDLKHVGASYRPEMCGFKPNALPYLTTDKGILIDNVGNLRGEGG